MATLSSQLQLSTADELRCVARFLRAENNTSTEIVERVNRVYGDATTDVREVCVLCEESDLGGTRNVLQGSTTQEWMYRDATHSNDRCQVSKILAFTNIG